MSARELQLTDGESSQFWRIELQGATHTVTYGRTGTDGASETKEFASATEAKQSHDTLLAQQLAKGYVDVGTLAGPEGADEELAPGQLPFSAFPCTAGSDGTYAHASSFMGLEVVPYVPGTEPADPANTVYRFANDSAKDNFEADLVAFLTSDAALSARGLVTGLWSSRNYDDDTSGIVKLLVDHRRRLPKLAGIFLGDIIEDEAQISWIEQSDLSPLLLALPGLQLLRVRGGDKLAFGEARHPALRALAIEAGGLDVSVVRSVLSGDLPNLEYLELWLGTEDYGGNSTVEDLQPLFAGKKFPKLRYLGLRNCDFVDDIASVVVNAPLLHQLETLDLSLGTLTDVGGQALLKLPKTASLKRLDLNYNYMSEAVIMELKQLPLVVDASDVQDVQEDDDGEFRFVSVGE